MPAAGTYETVHLTTEDGLQLESWFIKNDTAPAKGTVLMFHGHGGNRSANLPEAMAFIKMGYNVFMTDFRAHGNSDGTQCTIGIKEAADVKAAYDHVLASGEKNMVLWGISLGGATVLHAVAKYELKPQYVIAEMSYGSLYKAVNGRLHIMGLPQQPFAPLLTFWGGALNGVWAFGMQPEQFAKKITCPVLVQCGRKDERVSAAETNNIYNNLAGKKQLVFYEEAGHQSLYQKEPEKWQQTVKAFLQQ